VNDPGLIYQIKRSNAGWTAGPTPMYEEMTLGDAKRLSFSQVITRLYVLPLLQKTLKNENSINFTQCFVTKIGWRWTSPHLRRLPQQGHEIARLV